MSESPRYPKRLIEVDLPIKEISAHARREKSIRHGHISTLHIWWARRPLAACRAVICAALWPDPADDLCPPPFREAAARVLGDFAEKARTDKVVMELCQPHWSRWSRTTSEALDPADAAHWPQIRQGLLDFIADFANWDSSTVPAFLETARALTQAAHEALGGAPGTKPLVVDPFAGGGSIPLEALRVGADAFASDLNPVAVLLNKVVLEYIPKYACLPAGRASAPLPEPGKFYVYVLRCKDGSLYKGQTDDVPRRLKQHETGEVEWSAPRLPVELAHVETFDSRAEAVEREKYLKSGAGREWLEEKLRPRSLADEVRKWGNWIKQEAEKELAEFYPKDPDGATPIAYLWARTIQCEGPGCGAEVPLIRSLWLAKKANRSIALQLVLRPKAKRVDFQIIRKKDDRWVDQGSPETKISEPKFESTVKRGSATCPCCGYTTPVARVREQLRARRGGADDARLLCVVTLSKEAIGRHYRLPNDHDSRALQRAHAELMRQENGHHGEHSLVPDEIFPPTGLRRIQVPNYGIRTVGDLFSARQKLALVTISRLIAGADISSQEHDFERAVSLTLALVLDKQVDLSNSLNRWEPVAQCPRQLFARQSVPIVWDFAESVPTGQSSGSWEVICNTTARLISAQAGLWGEGLIQRLSATELAACLPHDSAHLVFTDPPYYDSVVYAHTADVFYPWLKRTVGRLFPDLFSEYLCPKDDEIVVDPPHSSSPSRKDASFFETRMTEALVQSRHVSMPGSIGVVVFAHQSTSGWEAMLQALLNAGWKVCASWPIDTEMETRVLAQGRAVLASSVHLVCRQREDSDSVFPADAVGDWRDVLQELPRRIHDWMPRLAEEGVVGADAIFACLGPALEIFSRYSRVEKASGEAVTLKEYLEHVWAAVAREALNMIFAGADATGFEEDARLTAMWLWTLKTGEGNGNGAHDDGEADDDEEGRSAKGKAAGFVLEYDAARKIAQGLGAHLESLSAMVEVKGETARLLPVAERTRMLFGKDEADAPSAKRKKRDTQLKLGFAADLEQAEEAGGWGQKGAPRQGNTVLDRIHQAMILFAAGRGEALKRFLVEEGVGRDDRFWRLAQALSALYPSSSDEKRWVDGVLARKKGLGF